MFVFEVVNLTASCPILQGVAYTPVIARVRMCMEEGPDGQHMHVGLLNVSPIVDWASAARVSGAHEACRIGCLGVY